jgi:NADH dehydrogenase
LRTETFIFFLYSFWPISSRSAPEQASRRYLEDKPMSRRVVILGAGFGGAYCARTLEKVCRFDDVDIVLCDRNNYFVFYPLLVEAGTGSLEPRHVVVPIRSFLKSPGIFRMGEVTDLDLGRRQVGLRFPGDERRSVLSYDHLVFALGSVTRLPDIPGLDTFGHEMKGLTDAVALRDRAIFLLESADATENADRRRAHLHFVVVGANFTGVEVAGEFHAFLKEAARRYPHVDEDDCRVTLVEIDSRILRALDPKLSEYARLQLERRGIEVRLESTVKEIHDDHLALRDGTELSASTVIWCAGIAPNPLQLEVGLPVDERGYLVCDRELRVTGCKDVWGIGDCAVNVDEKGKAYPATAQHAIRQGVHLARNIARVLAGSEPVAFHHRSRGSLAALGCRNAVADLFGVKLSGFLAWWTFRTVYLFKMPGIARKLRVGLDWTLELLFPREAVQLGIHRDDQHGRRADRDEADEARRRTSTTGEQSR